MRRSARILASIIVLLAAPSSAEEAEKYDNILGEKMLWLYANLDDGWVFSRLNPDLRFTPTSLTLSERETGLLQKEVIFDFDQDIVTVHLYDLRGNKTSHCYTLVIPPNRLKTYLTPEQYKNIGGESCVWMSGILEDPYAKIEEAAAQVISPPPPSSSAIQL